LSAKEIAMTSRRLILGFAAIASTLCLPGLGHATTCVSDADCAKGLSCQADATASTPAILCYDGDGGGACAPADNPLPQTMSCQAAPCLTSADCGQDMVCNGQTVTSCSGGTPVAVKCDPSTSCDAGPAYEPPTCTDTIVSACAYRWELQCNEDVDCGAGFTCQPTVTGMCSGSSGGTGIGSTGTASAGAGGASGSGGVPIPLPPELDAGAVPPPVTCTTVASFPGYCQAKATSCTVDSDCPSVWTCMTSNVATTEPAGPVGTDASAVVQFSDAGAPTPVPPPAGSVTGTCEPPAGIRNGGQPLGTGDTKGEVATADAGAAGPTKGTTTPPSPTAPGQGGTTTGQAAATTGGGGGCSIAASGRSTDSAAIFGVLAVLGLVIARRRRGN
jgi:hypothetical protein